MLNDLFGIHMSLTKLEIRKDSEEFQFIYTSDSKAESIATERAIVVRLLDDAIDALMRYYQMIESSCISTGHSVGYITKIYAKLP